MIKFYGMVLEKLKQHFSTEIIFLMKKINCYFMKSIEIFFFSQKPRSS